jgi:hypothetical protein
MFLRRYVVEDFSLAGCDGWLTLRIRFAFYPSHSSSRNSTPFVRESIDNGNKCL